ncbi:TolB family protein [Sandaracinus amylolyticus]|uniref:TolB family protein n=1 Tax=Sandaracinus amylolyticus TaxID=927083 RepID=UPI001F25BE0E|nr:hypothetical protein [Sandaracinus amylolyticus]UJR80432.1 Hypothetical protein I5071_24790 [Sandaracinus amylolyticus]
MQRHSSRRRAAALVLALVGLPAAGLTACAPDAAEPTRPRAIDVEDLPVIQVIEGEFDGEELSYRILTPEGLVDPSPAVGVAVEPLVDIPSQSCTTTTCTGNGYVTFGNVAGERGTVLNGALTSGSWVAACGSQPTGSLSGVCQGVRLRSLYTNQQVERAYAEMLELVPTGDTTSAEIVPNALQIATPDFGLAAPPVANGLFRFGELGRASTTVANTATMRWGFRGTTAGTTFTFRFVVQVRGLLVTPTVRASLADGARDNPGAGPYPTNTAIVPTSGRGIALSANGQFAAYVVGGTVHRKDLTSASGAVSTLVTGCTSVLNIDLSDDGSVLAYEAAGCPVAGQSQIYRYEYGSAGTGTLVSTATGGGAGNQASRFPRLNSDGSVIVFQSQARNLVGQTVPNGRGCPDVYRYDATTGEIHHVSAIRGSDFYTPTTARYAACANGDPIRYADVSDDGQRIVFIAGGQLDPALDTDATQDVYVYDHSESLTGSVVLYPITPTVTAPSHTGISGDGSVVAFCTDTCGRVVRASASEGVGGLEVVTANPAGAAVSAGANSYGIPSLSPSGRFIAFRGNGTAGLVPSQSHSGFNAPGTQIYVCDTTAPIAAPPANDLRRCWVASTIQLMPDTPFVPVSGAIQSGDLRLGLSYPSEAEAGYVAYFATPTNWGPLSTSGLFVSAVGDPRPQQPIDAR